MADEKKYSGPIDQLIDDDSGESGKSSGGGQSGQIEFHDFLGGAVNRDDVLPADEKKRLLSVHKDTHEAYVKKQKEASNKFQAVQKGQVSVRAYRQGLGSGAGMHSDFKSHPMLAKLAGIIDPKVNPLPTEMNAITNEGDKQKLENKLENQLKNRLAPGQSLRNTNTPTLKR